MLFNDFRRFIARLTQSHAKTASDEPASASTVSSVFDFDPMWHGDHWQNLLASPMDARRYVMEDWSASVPSNWDVAEAPAH